METVKMRRRFWTHSSRGRYPGGSKKDEKTIMYLAIIAIKYKVSSAELLDHVIEAWKGEEARLGQISIKRRETTEDSAIFLFIIGDRVVAQFSIPFRVFQERNRLERYMKQISASQNISAAERKVADLRVGMKVVNLRAKVLEKPELNLVYTRFGTKCYVSNALIGDKTGTIRISLWNEQTSKISKGDIIKIENGTIASFRGELQLRIKRKESLRIIEQEAS